MENKCSDTCLHKRMVPLAPCTWWVWLQKSSCLLISKYISQNVCTSATFNCIWQYGSSKSQSFLANQIGCYQSPKIWFTDCEEIWPSVWRRPSASLREAPWKDFRCSNRILPSKNHVRYCQNIHSQSQKHSCKEFAHFRRKIPFVCFGLKRYLATFCLNMQYPYKGPP